jgi:hypothetical protein
MSQIAIIAILLASFVMTLSRGITTTFALLYIPVLLLFSSIQPLPLPGLPDMRSTYAVVYGILLAVVLRGGQPLSLRWSVIDTLVVLCSILTVITSATTEVLWTGVSSSGEQFLNFLSPYFLARVAFNSPEGRRQALWSCVVCALLIGFFAVIEFRLFPFFYGKTLFQPFGLYTGHTVQVLHRYGFFRTQVSFSHPIDMGNACMLLAAFIGLLASTTSIGLRNVWVKLALAAALFGTATSMSFTSYIGVMATVALFCVLWTLPMLGRALIVFVAFALVVGVMVTSGLLAMETEDAFTEDETFHNSFVMRAIIVQRAWPFVETAGLLGYGKTIKRDDIDLDSVDNSYVLLIMQRGWLFISVFLMIPVVLALRAARAYGMSVTKSQRTPLTICVAAVLGMMVGMYTVWFGFVYAVMWTMMLGMSTSVMDTLLGRRPAPVAPPMPSAPVAHPTLPPELAAMRSVL